MYIGCIHRCIHIFRLSFEFNDFIVAMVMREYYDDNANSRSVVPQNQSSLVFDNVDRHYSTDKL